jgi:hypothetical protein
MLSKWPVSHEQVVFIFMSSIRADQNGAYCSGSSTAPQGAWEPYILEMFDQSKVEFQISKI